MPELDLKNSKPNLIIFIHGFRGGKETWITKSGNKSLFEFLSIDKEINEKYELVVFEYFTQLSDIFAKIRQKIGAVITPKIEVKRNLPIDEIADSNGIDLIVFRFKVMSSPVLPSPRVAPVLKIPFS